jgi:hypothetical protein
MFLAVQYDDMKPCQSFTIFILMQQNKHIKLSPEGGKNTKFVAWVRVRTILTEL